MKHTVIENENGGRYIINYTETTEVGKIVSHTETYEDAKAICKETEDTNIKNYMNSLPDEMRSPGMDDFIAKLIRNG